MTLVVIKPVFCFLDLVPHKLGCTVIEDTFMILEVEGLYYLRSENKGTDQLRGYREADLRLCFCICKNPVFA